MSFRTELKNSMIAAIYSVHVALGDTMSYTDRSGVTVTGLACHPNAAVVEHGEIIGAAVDRQRMRFEIAVQTNFPPIDGIFTGETVTDMDGRVWQVESWEDISGGYGAVFGLDCSSEQPMTMGVNEA